MISNENKQKAFILWDKLDDYTDQEFSFLKKYFRNEKIVVKYGFYNKESSKGKQIAVIFDLIPSQNRRTGVENNWEIISERIATDLEIEEYINYYFRKSYKRFLVFYYKSIDKLIYDDSKLGVETPNEFKEICQKRNYTGTFQLKLEI